MKRLDLLKQMSFGYQLAEDELTALASYFVETNQWARIANGDIDIIRGEKGAGKSAIYSLLMTRTGDFFDRGILLVPAENPRGATVFKDLVADPPTSEREFIVLWKLYALTIIAQEMREYDVRGANAERVYRALEDAKLLEREFSLAGVLRGVQDYARRIVKAEALEGGITIAATQMPSGITGRIVLKEPSSDLKQSGLVSVDGLFAVLNDAREKSAAPMVTRGAQAFPGLFCRADGTWATLGFSLATPMMLVRNSIGRAMPFSGSNPAPVPRTVTVP